MADFQHAEYRCLDKEGVRWERILPEDVDDVKPDNREKRLKRCITHITAGADRSLCRAFIRSEEEWRAACNRAGKEPGEGWLTRPGDMVNVGSYHAATFAAPKETSHMIENIADLLDDVEIPF